MRASRRFASVVSGDFILANLSRRRRRNEKEKEREKEREKEKQLAI